MQFKKGDVGNPKGRLKGCKNKYTIFKEQLLAQGKDIVSVIINEALAGDMNACKLCLERLIPKVSESTLEVNMTNILQNINTQNPMLTKLVEAVDGETLSFHEAQSLVKLFQELPDQTATLSEIIEKLNNTKRVYEQH